MQLANSDYIDRLYADFLTHPESVAESWRYFFEGMQFAEGGKGSTEYFRSYYLIDQYRRFGHLKASTNPIATQPPSCHELTLEALGFQKNDLKLVFPTHGIMDVEEASLENLIAVLEEIYCGTMSVEYMGCHSPEMEQWIQEHIEPSRSKPELSLEKKRKLLQDLNQAELFETFLHTKFVGQKRFSLEGCETLIPVLSHLIDCGSEEYVIGMAHRGRLNVLANILKKSYAMIFNEFEDIVDYDSIGGDGDVKYHKGFSSTVINQHGKQVHVGVAANPSHLESVNGIVLGKVFAKQLMCGDTSKERVIPILVHGDSSLAGQGIVYETMQLTGLHGYGTGGTIHLVVQNQVGFTTVPREYRSTKETTDIAHAFAAPVFHVNAEDPEGCVLATELAYQLRQQFHCDVFIEINGYRKYGHNEGDEPSFTQPLEYQMIRKKASIRRIYRDKMIHEGVVEAAIAKGLEEEFQRELSFELKEQGGKVGDPEAFSGIWEGHEHPSIHRLLEPVNTAATTGLLEKVVEEMSHIPEGFTLHPKLKKLVEERQRRFTNEIDWALAEHLAFGSLLLEGMDVRLSGQDSQRGTFTQRHAVWVDQKTGSRYFPLSHLGENQGMFQVYNSPLSEMGVASFEFGYSLANPETLVLWEAQFGDFANGAQVLFDQYLSCSGAKWSRYSGLTLLLPHGYEGQGAEHSSARIERFLQLGAEYNLQVVNPSTPAQYFHLLRRQMLRRVRVPLIVFTPKALLRLPACVSILDEFTSGTFQEYLVDEAKGAKRVLFCSGKIYYDLLSKRGELPVTLIRVEQLFPIHTEKLDAIVAQYCGGKEVYWVQEEPQNMGAWSYLAPILSGRLSSPLEYVGRCKSASSATGYHAVHQREQNRIVEAALGELHGD